MADHEEAYVWCLPTHYNYYRVYPQHLSSNFLPWGDFQSVLCFQSILLPVPNCVRLHLFIWSVSLTPLYMYSVGKGYQVTIHYYTITRASWQKVKVHEEYQVIKWHDTPGSGQSPAACRIFLQETEVWYNARYSVVSVLKTPLINKLKLIPMHLSKRVR